MRSPKITEFLRQQKKKAGSHLNRRYGGFELNTVSDKASIKSTESQTEKVIEGKKTPITKEEFEELESILDDLKSNVIESSNASLPQNFCGTVDAFRVDSINDFEELQTMEESSVFPPDFDELMDI